MSQKIIKGEDFINQEKNAFLQQYRNSNFHSTKDEEKKALGEWISQHQEIIKYFKEHLPLKNKNVKIDGDKRSYQKFIEGYFNVKIRRVEYLEDEDPDFVTACGYVNMQTVFVF